MAKLRKRRNWSGDEKRIVCVQTRFSGVSVSQVARRYDVNANQVFNWLKDPKSAPGSKGADATRFLPVEIVALARPSVTPVAVPGEIKVELVGGDRLKIIGVYDPDALARLIRGEAYPSDPGLTTCWVCGCHRQDVRLMFCHAQPLEIRPPDVPRRLRGALSR